MKSFEIHVTKDIVSMGKGLYTHIQNIQQLVHDAYDRITRPFICMDCSWHNSHPVPEPLSADYVCPHWTPEYWVEQGYERHWGDAAISNWPELEILRKKDSTGTSFIILAPRILRRPVQLSCEGFGWGSY